MVVKSLLTAFVLLSCLACFVFACDIFLASKCPSPPTYQAETFNYTAFCKETSDYVDCINKKLKNCKNVQEYGPALETIKWTFKISIKNVTTFNMNKGYLMTIALNKFEENLLFFCYLYIHFKREEIMDARVCLIKLNCQEYRVKSGQAPQPKRQAYGLKKK